MLSDTDRILEGLRMELESAKKNHESALTAFWSVAGDSRQLPRIPTGNPQPDGSEKIRDAFQMETEARRRYVEALHTFNYFVNHGEMPVVHSRKSVRIQTAAE